MTDDRTDQCAAPALNTAQDVLTRSNEVAKILGDKYSKLQNELLNPLVKKSIEIMEEQRTDEHLNTKEKSDG